MKDKIEKRLKRGHQKRKDRNREIRKSATKGFCIERLKNQKLG